FLAGLVTVAKPALFASANEDGIAVVSAAPFRPSPSDQRILGVIPNYQTVSDPEAPFVPLTVKEKWSLFAKESLDPFNGASALMGAALSQRGNANPRHGNGGKGCSQRVRAGMPDPSAQNLFSTAVLASSPHQDP